VAGTSDTIFALSSGSPPAGIAIIRISGVDATRALGKLTDRGPPKPRVATLRKLIDPDTKFPLDHALTLFFPGPNSATGEDVVELHLHGGRAVVAAVLNTLSKVDELRPADPGEFTRRAFENNRIDLATAEGLADLVSAETEAQRKNAIAQVGGSIHRMIEDWVVRLTKLAAQVEATIDFSDEDDVTATPVYKIKGEIDLIVAEMKRRISDPPAELLYSGVRVAIIGPPNAGKSTLLNRLINKEAALVSEIPGTTRDVIEVHTRIADLPLIFVDTAGIRLSTDDQIERMGIDKSKIESQTADIILALGGWDELSPACVIRVAAKADLNHSGLGLRVSAKTGEGLDELIELVTSAARSILPSDGGIALNTRHRTCLGSVISELDSAQLTDNELLVAEHLRLARRTLDDMVGKADTEAMLDALFGAFCIGK
jgi:tRNA modification GTPase